MKAVRIHQHGGREVLKYEDIPEPGIKANEVLVHVRACALNHLDLWVRNGLPGMKFAMPHILGSDIAGEVIRVGDLCERVKPGQRVLLSPGLSCRQCAQCVSGIDNQCRRYTLFGTGVDGGNREYMPAPEYTIIPIPDSLTSSDPGRTNRQPGRPRRIRSLSALRRSHAPSHGGADLASLFHRADGRPDSGLGQRR
jgi:NADPH:quinone reductase-like Zn-dependent oxidoreductase